MAYSVVIPTGDTIEVGSRGVVDVPLGFWKSLEEITLGSRVHGQLANLVRYDGPWANRLKEQNEHVLIVPWDIGESPSCAVISWTRSYRWLSPDSVILVIGIMREPRYWKNDRAVIDMQPSYVYLGPHHDLESLGNVAVSLEGEARLHVDSLLASNTTTVCGESIVLKLLGVTRPSACNPR